MTVNIVSLNANGLQSQPKRRSIFNTCRERKFDFCLLQEMHSTQNTEHLWQAEWGGKVFYSHGESNARGVAILVKRDSDFSVTKLYLDDEGRCVILKVTIHNEPYTLANIYAPTQDSL